MCLIEGFKSNHIQLGPITEQIIIINMSTTDYHNQQNITTKNICYSWSLYSLVVQTYPLSFLVYTVRSPLGSGDLLILLVLTINSKLH